MDLDALVSDLGLVKWDRSKRKLWNRFTKDEIFLVRCQWALEKARYFSYLFCRKAELPSHQMHLQSNALLLLSFVPSKANNIDWVLTPVNKNRRNSVHDCWLLTFSAPCRNCSRQSNGIWNLKSQGFDTLANLKCGWSFQGIFDTLVSLFKLPVRTNLLYES